MRGLKVEDAFAAALAVLGGALYAWLRDRLLYSIGVILGF